MKNTVAKFNHADYLWDEKKAASYGDDHDAVEVISKETIILIGNMKALLFEYKNILRNNYKFYSQDLLNNLFKHPFTKIEFVEQDLGVSRITAAKYLNQLAMDGFLRKEKLGTRNYYVNEKLIEILKI
jgi:Fic family protein|tara:strand:- start:549 stop:932 length:384 start_codon:yes stop_codon:yes gene_type:complete